MVNAALIVMTILGCDDSVSQCHYIKTVKGEWESVAACDRQSQTQLPAMKDAHYPVVVAMCETSGDAPIASAAGPLAPNGAIAAPPPSAAAAGPDAEKSAAGGSPQAQTGVTPAMPAAGMTVEPAPAPPSPPPLPQRAYALLKGALPDGQRLKRVLTGPVHSIGQGYSWIARKVSF